MIRIGRYIFILNFHSPIIRAAILSVFCIYQETFNSKWNLRFPKILNVNFFWWMILITKFEDTREVIKNRNSKWKRGNNDRREKTKREQTMVNATLHRKLRATYTPKKHVTELRYPERVSRSCLTNDGYFELISWWYIRSAKLLTLILNNYTKFE